MQNKTLVIIGAVVVLLLIIGGGIFILSQNNANPKASSDNTNNTPTNSNTPTSSTTSNQINISSMSFGPTLTVKKGTTITWTNKDPFNHIVVSDDGDFQSGTLGNGQTYSFTFADAGTFKYHCGIHSSMHGEVIVTE